MRCEGKKGWISPQNGNRPGGVRSRGQPSGGSPSANAPGRGLLLARRVAAPGIVTIANAIIKLYFNQDGQISVLRVMFVTSALVSLISG